MSGTPLPSNLVFIARASKTKPLNGVSYKPRRLLPAGSHSGRPSTCGWSASLIRLPAAGLQVHG